jgi:Kef-type K+ transport system membrane component KefB
MEGLIHDPLTRLMAQVIAVVLVSRLLGVVARRVGQPMVVAEIAAGILLGPSLLGWIAPDAAGALFAADSLPALHLISQLGLVLFMFLVGLHLDPSLLRGRTRASVVISNTSIAVPFALGVGLAFWGRGALAAPEVSFPSFALFMGAAMSITAFPVLARILAEQRLMRTRIGSVAIACAAVGDVTAWCILAFVAAIARAEELGGPLATTVLALLYVAVILRGVRPLVGRIAARIATPEGLTHNALAAVLVLLLASSWAAELIGIHALFGAFLFGAILPKEGGFARALAEKLEDLVTVALLPLFFAYSGVRTQIQLLDGPGDWALCAGIIAVACAGKIGGSAIAARLTGLAARESLALGVLMNTRGLMELVVLNIGLDLGVITPSLFTMMVIMALATTLMTTPLVRWLGAVEPEPAPALRDPGELTVVACVAYAASGPPLAQLASALCAGKGRAYALHLMTGTDRSSFFLGETQQQIAASALRPLLERAERLGLDARPLAFASSDPARDIRDVAVTKQAGLVLLGWHKPLLGRGQLGGTVYRVMQETPAEVGVLVDRGLIRSERLLVPYLGTPHDRAALALANRMLANPAAQLTVLHVVPPGRAARTSHVPEGVIGADVEGRAAFRTIEHRSPIDAVLDECASGYDLVLIGVHREWGLMQRLFSVQGERLIQECPTSLLVVRHWLGERGA